MSALHGIVPFSVGHVNIRFSVEHLNVRLCPTPYTPFVSLNVRFAHQSGLSRVVRQGSAGDQAGTLPRSGSVRGRFRLPSFPATVVARVIA
jgi:hypothetical protein